MGKTFSIELDEVTYQQLNTIAKEHETQLENTVVEAIKDYIKKRTEYVNDPFFRIIGSGKSGLSDLSEKHDKYLYGGK